MRVRDLTWAELIALMTGMRFVLGTIFSALQVILSYEKEKPGWSPKALARFEFALKLNSVFGQNLPHPPTKKE